MKIILPLLVFTGLVLLFSAHEKKEKVKQESALIAETYAERTYKPPFALYEEERAKD